MTNVTQLRPTIEDEFIDLIKDSEALVVIGKTKGDLKVMTNVTNSEVVMLMEAMKMEMGGAFLDDVLDELQE